MPNPNLSRMSTEQLESLLQSLKNSNVAPQEMTTLASALGLTSFDPQKALYESNYYEFFKAAFHILEPGTRFIDNWHLRCIADHVQAVVEGQITNLLINVPPGHCKAVADDQVVWLSDGSRKRVDEVQVGDILISMHGRRTQVQAVHPREKDRCITIRTWSGRKITCSWDHPLWTTRGWVVAEELTMDDSLAVMNSFRQSGSSTTRRDSEFVLAGYFIGDGHCGSYFKGAVAACITTANDDYEAHCCNAIRECGFSYTVVSRTIKRAGFVARKEGVHDIGVRRINVKGGVRTWLRDIGTAGQLSGTKVVPEFVFKGSHSQIAQFIAAYFHCDGTVYFRSKGRKMPCISFSSISRQLLLDVMELLSRLGIHGRLRTRVSNYNNEPYTSYTIDVSEENEARKFIERIPVIGYKADKMRKSPGTPMTFEAQWRHDRITDLVEAGEQPCRCFTVSRDRSFLCQDFVVSNSMLCTVAATPWAWTTDPTYRTLNTSYDAQLSFRDSMASRFIIESKWYQSLWGDRVQISKNQNEKSKYENTVHGWRMATSVGGRTTGEHPGLVIVDDPINAKKATSELERKAVIDWWRSTISTRGIIKGGRRIVIMQRLHEEDLSGYILDNERDSWEVICLPCRYEGRERMGRTCIGWVDPRKVEGELLWPEAFPEATVTQLESKLGPIASSGQLQQRPTPEGGFMFDTSMLVVVPTMPVEAYRIRYWDKASLEDDGDFTVGFLMAMTPDGMFIFEDVVRGQWSPGQRNRIMRQTATLDSARYNNSVVHWIEQEPGSSGKDSAMSDVKLLRGFPVYIKLPTGSKVTRAEPLAAQMSAGNCRMVQADWNREALHEFIQFPLGKYDDIVDAASGAFNQLADLEYDLPEHLLCSGESDDESDPILISSTDPEFSQLGADWQELLRETRIGYLEAQGWDRTDIEDEISGPPRSPSQMTIEEFLTDVRTRLRPRLLQHLRD